MSRRLLGLLSCAAALLALTGGGLYQQHRDDIDGFVALALGQGVVYALAVRLAWFTPPPRAMAVILGAAVAMRIAVLLAPPYLSSDIYRYVWDGRVIASGINPYRYVPTDPHLTALRDSEIFPKINRNNYARTIYPPAAEAIFFMVTRLSESLTAMRVAMVTFEAIAVGLMLAMLASAGMPASRIIIYAWHPLPLWEFAGSGHIDAALVALVAATLWLHRRGYGRLTGLALAASALVKFYPAVLLPALWRRRDWRMPAIFAGAVIVAYLPFFGAGWHVFGFLPQYVVEEGFTGGGVGFYLWNVLRSLPPLRGVPDIAYLAGASALLVGLALHVAVRPSAGLRGAALLAAAFMLLLSSHYAWYFTWLIVFTCLVGSMALGWLTLASFLLYLVPVWPQVVWNRHRIIVESIIYVPFLLLAATDWRRHRRREQAKHG